MNGLTTFYKEQLAKRTEQIESDTGLIVSNKFYTIKQFLLILLKNNKLPEGFIINPGKIRSLSSIAKKLCVENKYHYVKTNSLKFRHKNSVKAYPIEMLKQLYLQELKTNE
jgi:hypothetical protein